MSELFMSGDWRVDFIWAGAEITSGLVKHSNGPNGYALTYALAPWAC